MFKLGRLSREFNPRIPHMSAILGAKKLELPPESVDWTKGQTSFGVMLNDKLGDCSCAAIGHAIQIWTLNSSKESTQSDNSVLSLYESACGYNPNDPNSDQGGVLQKVLQYCSNTGVLLDNGQRDKFLAFMEVDIRNTNDVKIAINEFGLVYIGINVPTSIFDWSGDPKKIWDNENCSDLDGGHAIILVGYDKIGFTVISWGNIYHMTYSFFNAYCDEVYAIVSQDWIETTGKTPLGLTEEELTNLMSAIKEY